MNENNNDLGEHICSAAVPHVSSAVEETETASSYTAKVAALFKSRPYQPIDGMELEAVGGKYAWRTRVSNCRKQFGMTITNRVITLPNKSKRSLYTYAPEEAR